MTARDWLTWEIETAHQTISSDETQHADKTHTLTPPFDTHTTVIGMTAIAGGPTIPTVAQR